MAHTAVGMSTKRRVLTTCARLFLEKGYHKTTFPEILEKAHVSCSSFQNYFVAKDGVLTELVQIMYGNQFQMAEKLAGENLTPVYVYAVETAIQLAITEMNENLRDIYVEAYTKKNASEFIREETGKKLYEMLGSYQPKLKESDFHILDLGSMGMMRSFMACPCNEEMDLKKKIHSFLEMSLSAYHVPEKERKQIIAYVEKLDMRELAGKTIQNLFDMLSEELEISTKGLEVFTPAK